MEKPHEKGDPVSYIQDGTKIKGVITEIRRTNGPGGFAMVQSENDLVSVPLKDLKKEPENA